MSLANALVCSFSLISFSHNDSISSESVLNLIVLMHIGIFLEAFKMI